MDFYQLLHRHTETAPQRAAFHDLDRSINYQELKLEVDRLAALIPNPPPLRSSRKTTSCPMTVHRPHPGINKAAEGNRLVQRRRNVYHERPLRNR